MQVTSQVSVDFPKLKWGISAGLIRDLPDDKKAQEIILAHPNIQQVASKKDKLKN